MLPTTARRTVLQLALLTAFGAAAPAFAADPVAIGILIPGSKSDKGWMESGYDGMVAAQKAMGDKVKVQMIENINYADMEQALTNLATKNKLVIGVGGQTQAAVMKVAKRFPGTIALQDAIVPFDVRSTASPVGSTLGSGTVAR